MNANRFGGAVRAGSPARELSDSSQGSATVAPPLTMKPAFKTLVRLPKLGVPPLIVATGLAEGAGVFFLLSPLHGNGTMSLLVLFGALVIPPILDLLNSTFGFQGAPGAGPNALSAPQASLISAILRDEPKPVSQIERTSPAALDRIVGPLLAERSR